MDVNNILDELKKKFSINSEAELARFLSISTSGLANWRRRNAIDVHKVLASFPAVDANWLFTGEGEMLKNDRGNNNAQPYEPQHIINVPVVPYSARAGSMAEYEQIFSDDIYTQQPVFLDDVPRGKYLCFTVTGDSMEEEFRDGDRVLARHVHIDLWRHNRLHLKRWGVWVIVTRMEGILIKNIVDHDVANGVITCHSFNQMYQDFEVQLSDVIDIYNVVQLVRRNY